MIATDSDGDTFIINWDQDGDLELPNGSIIRMARDKSGFDGTATLHFRLPPGQKGRAHSLEAKHLAHNQEDDGSTPSGLTT